MMSHVQEVEQGWINSYVDKRYGVEWKPGDFVLHAVGHDSENFFLWRSTSTWKQEV